MARVVQNKEFLLQKIKELNGKKPLRGIADELKISIVTLYKIADESGLDLIKMKGNRSLRKVGPKAPEGFCTLCERKRIEVPKGHDPKFCKYCRTCRLRVSKGLGVSHMYD